MSHPIRIRSNGNVSSCNVVVTCTDGTRRILTFAQDGDVSVRLCPESRSSDRQIVLPSSNKPNNNHTTSSHELHDTNLSQVTPPPMYSGSNEISSQVCISSSNESSGSVEPPVTRWGSYQNECINLDTTCYDLLQRFNRLNERSPIGERQHHTTALNDEDQAVTAKELRWNENDETGKVITQNSGVEAADCRTLSLSCNCSPQLTQYFSETSESRAAPQSHRRDSIPRSPPANRRTDCEHYGNYVSQPNGQHHLKNQSMATHTCAPSSTFPPRTQHGLLEPNAMPFQAFETSNTTEDQQNTNGVQCMYQCCSLNPYQRPQSTYQCSPCVCQCCAQSIAQSLSLPVDDIDPQTLAALVSRRGDCGRRTVDYFLVGEILQNRSTSPYGDRRSTYTSERTRNLTLPSNYRSPCQRRHQSYDASSFNEPPLSSTAYPNQRLHLDEHLWDDFAPSYPGCTVELSSRFTYPSEDPSQNRSAPSYTDSSRRPAFENEDINGISEPSYCSASARIGPLNRAVYPNEDINDVSAPPYYSASSPSSSSSDGAICPNEDINDVSVPPYCNASTPSSPPSNQNKNVSEASALPHREVDTPSSSRAKTNDVSAPAYYSARAQSDSSSERENCQSQDLHDICAPADFYADSPVSDSTDPSEQLWDVSTPAYRSRITQPSRSEGDPRKVEENHHTTYRSEQFEDICAPPIDGTIMVSVDDIDHFFAYCNATTEELNQQCSEQLDNVSAPFYRNATENIPHGRSYHKSNKRLGKIPASSYYFATEDTSQPEHSSSQLIAEIIIPNDFNVELQVPTEEGTSETELTPLYRHDDESIQKPSHNRRDFTENTFVECIPSEKTARSTRRLQSTSTKNASNQNLNKIKSSSPRSVQRNDLQAVASIEDLRDVTPPSGFDTSRDELAPRSNRKVLNSKSTKVEEQRYVTKPSELPASHEKRATRSDSGEDRRDVPKPSELDASREKQATRSNRSKDRRDVTKPSELEASLEKQATRSNKGEDRSDVPKPSELEASLEKQATRSNRGEDRSDVTKPSELEASLEKQATRSNRSKDRRDVTKPSELETSLEKQATRSNKGEDRSDVPKPSELDASREKQATRSNRGEDRRDVTKPSELEASLEKQATRSNRGEDRRDVPKPSELDASREKQATRSNRSQDRRDVTKPSELEASLEKEATRSNRGEDRREVTQPSTFSEPRNKYDARSNRGSDMDSSLITSKQSQESTRRSRERRSLHPSKIPRLVQPSRVICCEPQTVCVLPNYDYYMQYNPMYMMPFELQCSQTQLAYCPPAQCYNPQPPVCPPDPYCQIRKCDKVEESNDIFEKLMRKKRNSLV